MNLGTFFQDLAQKVPGNKFAQTRLGDVLTGGLARAVNRNDWRLPGYGSDQTSVDDLAAVGTGGSGRYRSVARGVGSLFGLWGLGSAASGLGSGASEVGEGFPLAEEAGGPGAGGQLSGPSGSSGSTLADYLRRYGRQGANLLSSMGQGGGGWAAPVDNSMIAPIRIADPYAETQPSIPPEILALMLARPQSDDHADQPYISGGGYI